MPKIEALGRLEDATRWEIIGLQDLEDSIWLLERLEAWIRDYRQQLEKRRAEEKSKS